MHEWVRRGVGTVAVVLAIVSSAFATPQSLPQTILPGVGSTSWEIRNDGGTDGGPFAGVCDGSPAFGFDDATSASGAGDAYDGAWSVWINGNPFVAPGGLVDLTGTTLLAGPVAMSGLNVWVQYFFSTTHQAARILVILQNPSPVAANVTVQVPINFGSDSNTTVGHTSSGDTTVTTADRWVVTSDGGPGDAVNTTVFYGPGSPALVPTSYTQTVFHCATRDGIGATFNVSVPGSSARALLFFAGLGDIAGTGNSIAVAIANATLFDSVTSLANSTDLLSGVTVGTSQSALVLNWEGLSVQLPQQVRTAAAPLVSNPLLVLFCALMLAGFGCLQLRRARAGAPMC